MWKTRLQTKDSASADELRKKAISIFQSKDKQAHFRSFFTTNLDLLQVDRFVSIKLLSKLALKSRASDRAKFICPCIEKWLGIWSTSSRWRHRWMFPPVTPVQNWRHFRIGALQVRQVARSATIFHHFVFHARALPPFLYPVVSCELKEWLGASLQPTLLFKSKLCSSTLLWNQTKWCKLPHCSISSQDENWTPLYGCLYSFHEVCLNGSTSSLLCKDFLKQKVTDLGEIAEKAILDPSS